MNLTTTKDQSKFEAYTRHVLKYSERSSSIRGDMYSAFAGILNALFGNDQTWCGLPLQHFERALRWEFLCWRSLDDDLEDAL